MKKEFKLGMPLESNTEYFATEAEYHVYEKDTSVVYDTINVLRANDTKEFNVFCHLKDKKNVTLDFCGATLIMHGKIQPFFIDSCEGVTIKNCNVTYERPPFTELLITEVTPEYARLRLNENCPCRIENGKLIPYGENWESTRLNYNGMFYQIFDGETRRGCGIHLGVMGSPVVMEKERPFHIRRFMAEADGDDIILRGELHPVSFKAGRVLVIGHESRSLSNVFAFDTKDLRIENYRILSGRGMGIYTYRVENITLDGFRLTHDEKSPCIVANAADAVHSFGTSGKFEIRNSIFEGMIDDAINIHANFRTVARIEGNDLYTHCASCEPQANGLYRVGDVIAVYRGKTMEESARYKITAIEVINSDLCKFTLDRPAENHQEGDLIESITANCDVIIENCVFGKANSHLRLQSRGKFIIRNCEIELPLLLSGDASYWFESGPLTDLTVENCRFVGDHAKIAIKSEVFPTEAEPYYHKNLKILNNTFDVDVPLKGGYADGIVFKGNTNSDGKPMTLLLTNCGEVDAENCKVERIFAVKDKLVAN